MTPLSQWLQIMLAEIARKRDDLERALEEQKQRDSESSTDPPPRGPGPRATQR